MEQDGFSNEWGKILKLLNPPQIEAVLHKDGPLLVLAGAGSGKTRVITYRIVRLIAEEGVSPDNILAVTFTNKASREMKNRVEATLGDRAARVNMGTFHAICAKMLRRHAEAAGFRQDFNIFDTDDQKVVLTRIMNELAVSSKEHPPNELLSAFSRYKDKLMEPEDVPPPRFDEDRTAYELYGRYQESLRRQNAMDFGDLIMVAVKLLREVEEVRRLYNRKWKYILVDEFQDTNRAQLQFLRYLTEDRQNICVVGDDDQSIYSWRGAEVRNILDFEKLYEGTKVVTLDRNYRSTQQILECSNAVIQANHARHKKTLWTDIKDGRKPIIYSAFDSIEEVNFVAREIRSLMDTESYAPSDFAVFYRANFQSRLFEDKLSTRKIPFQVVGGFRFYERKEIKDMLAYLRCAVSPGDDVSFLRVINTPARGLGDAAIEKMAAVAKAGGKSLLEGCKEAAEAGALGNRARDAALKFVELILKLRKQNEEKAGPAKLISAIFIESGYKDMLEQDGDVDAESRMENIAELINLMEEHEAEGLSIPEILELVALRSDVDTMNETDAVTLMTIHSAKGLEFKVVFVTGLEDGLFPSWHHAETEGGLAEERRLAYVAMTRAKERLYMSWSQFRPRSYSKGVSQFLTGIPKDLVMYKGAKFPGADDEREGDLYLFGKPAVEKENGRETKVVYDDDYARNKNAAAFSGRPEERHKGFGKDDDYLAGLEKYRHAKPGRPETGVTTYAPKLITPEMIRSGEEIPERRTAAPKIEKPIPPAGAPSGEGQDFRPGDMVYHPIFGMGKVMKIVGGKGSDANVSVQFPGRPLTKLKAKFIRKA